ncbi:hypothetical protein LCGC14_1547000 [marine sediment metagenome]|uniref:Terminase large subunit gp17-like C-terminal domain-containing protein n=1 Tax=marine sediment metagenome TaxID=412755 RepID=A0A0F9L794_9ZZZZ
MPNDEQKRVALEELEELVGIKRHRITQANLAKFIQIYLPHLTPAQSPLFHKEMLSLMQGLIWNVNTVQNNSSLSNSSVQATVERGTMKQDESVLLSKKERENRTIASESPQEGSSSAPSTVAHSSLPADVNSTIGAEKDNKSNKVLKNENIDTVEGMDDPPVARDMYIIPAPHISNKNTNVDSKEELGYNQNDLDYNRVLFIAPRGFAKSMLCSRFFPLWLAVNGYKKDIFLASATVSLAIENLRIIRTELEANEKLIADYGDLKSDKWTEEMLVLNNGVVIRAKGQGFQIRGFRPDIIVCDDLEDENMIYSKDQREKLEHWFFRTLMPSLKPEQNLLYVGTKLHQASLISKLEEKPEFLNKFYAALTNGKSIWEEYWPTITLLKLQKELGAYAFQAEYQNNPISLEDQPIKPHYIDGVRIGGGIKVRCLAIDPAISEKTGSDYRAFTLFGQTDEGFKEIYSERGHWGIDEQIDRIIGIWKRFKLAAPDRIIIESVAFQKVYKSILAKKAREEGIWLPISEAELGMGKDKRPKDKMTRLLAVSHLFEQKLVQIDNPDLREELLAFPTGDNDDLVDATVYALYWLMNFRAGKSFVKKEKVKIIDAVKSFYVKEVRLGVYFAKIGEPPIEEKTNFISYDH